MNNMHKNLLSIPTTPVENLVTNFDLFVKHYLTFTLNLKKIQRDLVKVHQKKLGKQLYTFTGEYRYWVWEFKDGKDLLRVFVSNKKGICLETIDKTSESKINQMVHSYYNKMLI